MRLGVAIAAVGVALAATTGVASAQETRAERTATAAQVPWYERFTYSSGNEQIPSWSSVNPRAPNQSATKPTARWGLTVNVGQAEQQVTSRAEMPVNGKEAALGAYYRFSPTFRVGGQVSVAPQSVPQGAPRSADERAEPAAGVRLESAIRF